MQIHTVENGTPRGICGSGLIDLISELRRCGLLDETGRLEPVDPKSEISADIRDRLVPWEGDFGFVLARGGDAANPQDIVLTPRDVREFQLAKGALFAGVQVLLKEWGIGLSEVAEILIAGAFGNYIRPAAARRVGLLPDFPLDKIRFIGNAAGGGARAVLLSRSMREEASAIARKARYVELAGRSDFQDIFSEAMLFPEKILS